MDNILGVADYIFTEYKKISGEFIDEMKLHKLLYFAQRESLALTGKELFECDFEGWKYGPVSPSVRAVFVANDGINAEKVEISDEAKYIIKNVIFEYGIYSSWKLSEISHKEISWLNSRKGLDENDCGSNKLALEDIIEDAKKVRPYDHIWDMYYDEFENVEEPNS